MGSWLKLLFSPLAENLIRKASDIKEKPKRIAPRLTISEAAGELADEHNISCEPYRAPVMTADEARTAGSNAVQHFKSHFSQLKGADYESI